VEPNVSREVDKDGVVPRNTPDWSPESEEDYELARRRLKKLFSQWSSVVGAAIENDAVETPIHYKWAYLDGHLTRWTCEDLDDIYLELHPAKVIVEDDNLAEILNEAKTFIRFLDETGLLDPDSEPADVLVDRLDAIEQQFCQNMADTSRYSFGKRMWMTARAEGVHINDRASVEAFITDFNSRPIAQRDAVLGPSLVPRPHATSRITPPGTPPKPRSSKRRKHRR
jgi:hypothetical protein